MAGQTSNVRGFVAALIAHFEAVTGQRESSLVVYCSLALFGLVFSVVVACSQMAYWGMRSRGFDLLSPGLRAVLGDRSEEQRPQKSEMQEPVTAKGKAGKRAHTWSFFAQPASFGSALQGAYATKSNYLIGFALWFILGPIGKAKQKKGDVET